MIAYHVTPTRLVTKILHEGLRPHEVPGDPYVRTRRKRAVFLASTPELAEWAASEPLGDITQEGVFTGFDEPVTLLEVVVPRGARLYRDKETFGEDVWYTKSPIPPENIKVVKRSGPGIAGMLGWE